MAPTDPAELYSPHTLLLTYTIVGYATLVARRKEVSDEDVDRFLRSVLLSDGDREMHRRDCAVQGRGSSES